MTFQPFCYEEKIKVDGSVNGALGFYESETPLGREKKENGWSVGWID
jgi:hypothetical protein